MHIIEKSNKVIRASVKPKVTILNMLCRVVRTLDTPYYNNANVSFT